jgi:protein-S-isoprenylcysteine O-methyltransferase Ste14
MAVFHVFVAGWLVLIGFDAVRFGWSAVPVWLQWIGEAGVARAIRICYLTFQRNTLPTSTPKIRTERGQEVVYTGPYAMIRHPHYAAVLIFFPSSALMLGSWWGVASTILLAAGLVARTAIEVRELQRAVDAIWTTLTVSNVD